MLPEIRENETLQRHTSLMIYAHKKEDYVKAADAETLQVR